MNLSRRRRLQRPLSKVKNMKYRFLYFSSISILAASLSVFPQAQAPATQTAPEEPPPAYSVPKDYRYDAKGRRDPFVNPVPKPKAAEAAAIKNRPPGLKGVLVNEAQISGVVTSNEPTMNVVVIAAPGGKAAYFARVGDQLFDAVVKTIKADAVTFVLTASNTDSKAPREVVRKVHPNPGEEK
jgi:hypothetical protein